MFPLRNRSFVSALVLLASIGLTACGGDAERDPSVVPPESIDTIGERTENNNIVRLAEDSELTAFRTAIEAGGMADFFRGAGPYTVFVPNDTAFQEMPIEFTELIQVHQRDRLNRTLMYHVVPRRITSTSFMGETMVTTQEGLPLIVSAEAGRLTLRDGQGNVANVIRRDLTAANGIIHVIDRVLTPSRPQMTDPEGVAPEGTPAPEPTHED
jgi:uncharacterized surface protein with fasciclin (FAS1) repeats